jgi:hypothetical protein
LNGTTNYVETHHKPCGTAPQNESEQSMKRQLEQQTAPRTQTEKPKFHSEKIFQHSTYVARVATK